MRVLQLKLAVLKNSGVPATQSVHQRFERVVAALAPEASNVQYSLYGLVDSMTYILSIVHIHFLSIAGVVIVVIVSLHVIVLRRRRHVFGLLRSPLKYFINLAHNTWKMRTR